MKKVICIGECLIDFMPSEADNMTFVAKAGGAPSNVCACVAKLGGSGCYLGKLSSDNFSKFLIKEMEKCGVDTRYVTIDDKYNTALAFVTLSDLGDREFVFYRKESADLMLSEQDINSDIFSSGDILHFCSVGLVESPSKYAHKKAIESAIQHNAIVSFDVNVRFGLWQSKENCKTTIIDFLQYADIIKVTDEELFFITNENNEANAIDALLKMATRCKLVFVTKGKNGANVFDRNGLSIFTNAVDVKVIDTTGAGDCFAGCVLYCLASDKATLTLDGIKEAVQFASLGCGVVIGKKGAMQSMPTHQEILELKENLEK